MSDQVTLHNLEIEDHEDLSIIAHFDYYEFYDGGNEHPTQQEHVEVNELEGEDGEDYTYLLDEYNDYIENKILELKE